MPLSKNSWALIFSNVSGKFKPVRVLFSISPRGISRFILSIVKSPLTSGITKSGSVIFCGNSFPESSQTDFKPYFCKYGSASNAVSSDTIKYSIPESVRGFNQSSTVKPPFSESVHISANSIAPAI